MRWQYDQGLVEAVVFQEIQQAEGQGRHGVVRDYHAQVNRAYEIAAAEQREQAFFAAHWHYFHVFGCDQLLVDACRAYPRLHDHVCEGVVRRALSRREEWADLFIRDDGLRTVLLRVRPDQFLDRQALGTWFRHELTHIDDMLDPAFGYDQRGAELLAGTTEARMAQERYRLLWSLSVDGRNARAGAMPLVSREERAREFYHVFRFVDRETAHTHFERLWVDHRPSHVELLTMAQQHRTVFAAQQSRVGQQCPLCQFPTHVWARPEALSARVIQRIRQEFPDWTREHGACDRCVDVYVAQEQATVTQAASR